MNHEPKFHPVLVIAVVLLMMLVLAFVKTLTA